VRVGTFAKSFTTVLVYLQRLQSQVSYCGTQPHAAIAASLALPKFELIFSCVLLRHIYGWLWMAQASWCTPQLMQPIVAFLLDIVCMYVRVLTYLGQHLLHPLLFERLPFPNV